MRILIPGRFQPWHKGHSLLVKSVKQLSNEIIIGIREDKPFSFAECLTMAKLAYPDIDVVPLSSDLSLWQYSARFDIIATGNTELGLSLVKLGYTTLFLPRHNDCSGTDIRKKLADGESIKNLVDSENLILELYQNAMLRKG